MTTKDRNYLFVIMNVLLLIAGITIFVVIISRSIPKPAFNTQDHQELIQKMTDVRKLKDLLILDNVYIRSLEDFVSTSRFILLFSSIVGGAFGLINLVLIPWRGSALNRRMDP